MTNNLPCNPLGQKDLNNIDLIKKCCFEKGFDFIFLEITI